MSSEVLTGIAIFMALVAGFGLHRSVQRKRVARVTAWIRDFLFARYGSLPDDLSIHCTDDQLWPVLVEFRRSLPATRHRLQFMCSGVSSTFALVSEKEERRAPVN